MAWNLDKLAQITRQCDTMPRRTYIVQHRNKSHPQWSMGTCIKHLQRGETHDRPNPRICGNTTYTNLTPPNLTTPKLQHVRGSMGTDCHVNQHERNKIRYADKIKKFTQNAERHNSNPINEASRMTRRGRYVLHVDTGVTRNSILFGGRRKHLRRRRDPSVAPCDDPSLQHPTSIRTKSLSQIHRHQSPSKPTTDSDSHNLRASRKTKQTRFLQLTPDPTMRIRSHNRRRFQHHNPPKHRQRNRSWPPHRRTSGTTSLDSSPRSTRCLAKSTPNQIHIHIPRRKGTY